ADHVAGGADDLLFAVDGDDQRSAEGEGPVRLAGAFGAPADGALVSVEGDDLAIGCAVGAEDEQVIDADGRAAVAVDGGVTEGGVRPQDLAFEVETGGTLMAEVDEDLVAIDDGRGAGVAVLGVDARGAAAVLTEGLDVPQDLAVFGVEAKDAERAVAGAF